MNKEEKEKQCAEIAEDEEETFSGCFGSRWNQLQFSSISKLLGAGQVLNSDLSTIFSGNLRSLSSSRPPTIDSVPYKGLTVDGDCTQTTIPQKHAGEVQPPDTTHPDAMGSLPRFNIAQFKQATIETAQKVRQATGDTMRELRTLLSKEDAVDPGESNSSDSVKQVFEQTSQWIAGACQGVSESLKGFGIHVCTTTEQLCSTASDECIPARQQTGKLGDGTEYKICGDSVMENSYEEKLHAVPERLSFGCDRSRSRSLTASREVPMPGRPMRVQRETGNETPERRRSRSQPPEMTRHERNCVNCSQNPVEESEEIVVRRSLSVKTECYYCQDITAEPEVCIPTKRYVCQKEECQRQATATGKATIDEE